MTFAQTHSEPSQGGATLIKQKTNGLSSCCLVTDYQNLTLSCLLFRVSIIRGSTITTYSVMY